MSFPNPVTCCCDKNLYRCCVSGDVKYACPREVDLGNCQVGPGEPDSITINQNRVICVESEDKCDEQCDGVSNCTAVFYGDALCEGDVPPPGSYCEPQSEPCTKFKCGPCGPIADGCTMACPPTIPTCTPQDCCEPPPPPVLCCCWTIVDNCVTDRTCLPCPDNIPAGTHCYVVDTCDECFFPPGGPCILLTTTCCTSGNPDCCDNEPGCDPSPGGCCVSGCSCVDLCCCDCATPGCAFERCYCDCDDFVPPQPPLCPCTEGPSRNCGPFGPFAQEGKPNGFDTFAEGRLTSGFISVDSAYSLNTLFLFGYGNKHL
jgi:hypothetical protein